MSSPRTPGRARPNRSAGRRPEGRAGVLPPQPIFPPVIRPLRVEKAEDCARLHGSNFAHPWPAEEIASLIASPSTLAAAALDPASGELRGFILARLAADETEILTIAVHHGLRRKGVGRALLAEIIRQAASAGAHVMFLEVDEENGSAVALYRRLGFVKVGERAGYYLRDDGRRATAIVMRRFLS